MNVNASPFVLAAAGSDTSLAALLELLASHDEKLLVLQCGLQPGGVHGADPGRLHGARRAAAAHARGPLAP